MASIPESRGLPRPQPVVNYDEPPEMPPPLLAVGPLAWVRNNLFRTPVDALVTVVVTVGLIGLIGSFLNWAIRDANWFVINFNLRLYIMGRYEPEYEWRLALLAVLAALTIGLLLAAFTRLPRSFFIGAVVLVAVTFVVPPLIGALAPKAQSNFAVGAVDIAGQGNDVVRPNPQTAFIARGGETISVGLRRVESESELAEMAGFTDRAANQLGNAALTRLSNLARIADINDRLAQGLLTPGQTERLTAEVERLTVADPTLERYRVNQVSVLARLLDGATGEMLAERELGMGGEPLTLTAPGDGWYILEATVAEEGSVGLLETRGIYPVLQRSLTGDRGDGRVGSFSEYARMTDSFTVVEGRPRDANGRDLPMNGIIDNQFRGLQTPGEYLSLFLGPFLAQINIGLLLLFAALVAGYVIGILLDQTLSPAEDRRRISRRAALWSFIALLPLTFVLVAGVGSILPLTDTRRWGGFLLTVLLTVVGILASFPLGVLLALGRRSRLPVVSTLCTIYIEFVRGVPFITVLFMAQLLVPLINPTLAEVPAVYRAMVGTILFVAAYLAENVRGGLQSLPPGQEEAARALGLNGLQVTTFILLPQALRAVIPALVGMFISLFKDTSLVAIVGLQDLSGIADNVVAQTEFLGLRPEVYFFIIIVYFVCSYAMAAVSRRIEASGSGRTLIQKI